MADRSRAVHDAFYSALAGILDRAEAMFGRSWSLDVRENVVFRGRELARWVHDRYPETGTGVDFNEIVVAALERKVSCYGDADRRSSP